VLQTPERTIAAFLLAFREGAGYDSVNYRWFAQRYERFLYVDRVVVAPAARGQGAASQLAPVAQWGDLPPRPRRPA
jgi:predicted GNAT superfamily acetyltransferase